MVLHGSQDNIEQQLLICEIKKWGVSRQRMYLIWKDLIKLKNFLHLIAPDDKPAGFKSAAFIIYGKGLNVESFCDMLKAYEWKKHVKYHFSENEKNQIFCIICPVNEKFNPEIKALSEILKNDK